MENARSFPSFTVMWHDLSEVGVTPLAFDASAKTDSLDPGVYLVIADQAFHIRTGPQATVVATTTQIRIPAEQVWGVVIDRTNDAIAAIKSATAGTLTIQRVALL